MGLVRGPGTRLEVTFHARAGAGHAGQHGPYRQQAHGDVPGSSIPGVPRGVDAAQGCAACRGSWDVGAARSHACASGAASSGRACCGAAAVPGVPPAAAVSRLPAAANAGNVAHAAGYADAAGNAWHAWHANAWAAASAAAGCTNDEWRSTGLLQVLAAGRGLHFWPGPQGAHRRAWRCALPARAQEVPQRRPQGRGPDLGCGPAGAPPAREHELRGLRDVRERRSGRARPRRDGVRHGRGGTGHGRGPGRRAHPRDPCGEVLRGPWHSNAAAECALTHGRASCPCSCPGPAPAWSAGADPGGYCARRSRLRVHRRGHRRSGACRQRR
mmetsp:Transcript_58804/g.151211  ORF Transcript_58804/g.151211 Transcript_58804/m.151211 type:complete len:328 (+) Transcript_58804:4439-5422(+)